MLKRIDSVAAFFFFKKKKIISFPFPFSTGVIGQQLPMEKLTPLIPDAAQTLSVEPGGADASQAILTTDLVSKTCARRVQLADGTSFTVGGIAKGSGMIHPNMATTLCFVTTDLRIAPPRLQQALSAAADATFNCLTVDGDTSTNDMVGIMANGESNVDEENASDVFDVKIIWARRGKEIYFHILCFYDRHLVRRFGKCCDRWRELLRVTAKVPRA